MIKLINRYKRGTKRRFYALRQRHSDLRIFRMKSIVAGNLHFDCGMKQQTSYNMKLAFIAFFRELKVVI